jgi:tetratricopeptide (TPR) repeat protein
MFKGFGKKARWTQCAAVVVLVIASFAFTARGQAGNSIGGFVFGLNRTPMTDVIVELLDEYSRTIQRGRTNGSGRYSFYGLAPARFKVRVLPYGTDYEDQEQEVEIVSFSASGSSGGRLAGASNEQRDFFLRLRKGVDPSSLEVVFVQNVPDEAKKLYERGVAQLSDKKDAEGLADLKAALEIFPNYFAALHRLGTEYVRLGHFDASAILLKMAVDVNERSGRSWYGLAYSYYSLKDNENAFKSVTKLLEISPSSPDGLLLSGVLLRLRKQFPESEKQLLKAMDIVGDSIPQIHWELALLYGNNLNRYADAAKHLKLFLKLQPETKDADNIRKLISKFEEKAAAPKS